MGTFTVAFTQIEEVLVELKQQVHIISQLLEFAHACSGPVYSYVRPESAHYSGSSPLRIGPVSLRSPSVRSTLKSEEAN